MYTSRNFQTKKQLREAVARGERITVFSPGPFPAPSEGIVSLEGPHYPRPHSWYARAEIRNGVVVKVW